MLRPEPTPQRCSWSWSAGASELPASGWGNRWPASTPAASISCATRRSEAGTDRLLTEVAPTAWGYGTTSTVLTWPSRLPGPNHLLMPRIIAAGGRRVEITSGHWPHYLGTTAGAVRSGLAPPVLSLRPAAFKAVRRRPGAPTPRARPARPSAHARAGRSGSAGRSCPRTTRCGPRARWASRHPVGQPARAPS